MKILIGKKSSMVALKENYIVIILIHRMFSYLKKKAKHFNKKKVNFRKDQAHILS
jgi:hypothetical protein